MDKTLDTIRLMLEGSGITLEIFCVTLALSLPLGLFVALGRLSHFRPLSRILEIYIWIMRGTPLMLQLLFVYFALPMVGILLPDIEAARVLGMSGPLTMRRIILPQVLRITLPPVSNETINLVKDTSLVYILAMNDLLRVARTIVQREFDMTPFLIAGIFYLAMTAVLTYGFKKLEAHYGRYGN